MPAPRISALTPNRMYARGQLSDGNTAEFIFRLYACLHEISHVLHDQFGSLPFARLSTKIYLSRGSSNYLLEASFVLVRYKIVHWIFTSCIIFSWISQCQILVQWEQPLGFLLNMVVRSNGTVAVCLALRLQAHHLHPGQGRRRDQEAVLCERQVIVAPVEKGRETVMAVRTSKTNHLLDRCLRNGAVVR